MPVQFVALKSNPWCTTPTMQPGSGKVKVKRMIERNGLLVARAAVRDLRLSKSLAPEMLPGLPAINLPSAKSEEEEVVEEEEREGVS